MTIMGWALAVTGGALLLHRMVTPPDGALPWGDAREAWLPVLELAVVCIAARGLDAARWRRIATSIGAIAYVGALAAATWMDATRPVALCGAVLLAVAWAPSRDSTLDPVRPMWCVGALIAATLVAIGEGSGFAGAASEEGMRHLRLARAASWVLPVLWLVHQRAAGTSDRRAARWGRVALTIGVVGMPLVLVLAAGVDTRIRYAASIAADAIIVGVATGAILARSPGDRAAWCLLLVALLIGRVVSVLQVFAKDVVPPYVHAAPAWLFLHALGVLLSVLVLLRPRSLPFSPTNTGTSP